MEKPITVFYLILSSFFLFRLSPTRPWFEQVEFPFLQAAKLIRELNLFPKKGVDLVNGLELPLLAGTGKKIVEKLFKFPNLVQDSGGDVSVEDLAHHAGYYKLAHIHDVAASKTLLLSGWLEGQWKAVNWLLFYENGPFNIANNMSLVCNEHGWDKVSSS